MLVCDRCTENSAVGRLEAQTWCIENAFELVELNPEVESDSETEDDFKETTGIKRIVQSLHAHTWPNLQLKEDHHLHVVSPFMRQLMKEEHNAKKLNNDSNLSDNDHSIKRTENTDDNLSSINRTDPDNRLCSEQSSINSSEKQSVSCDNIETEENDKNICVNKSDDNKEDTKQDGSEGACGDSVDRNKEKAKKKSKKKPSKEERLDSLLPSEDMALFEALGDEDPGGESFEKLFEKFANMKEKANGLPLQERKKYAENVAIAFWRAIGGDEDEIGDLDSDG